MRSHADQISKDLEPSLLGHVQSKIPDIMSNSCISGPPQHHHYQGKSEEITVIFVPINTLGFHREAVIHTQHTELTKRFFILGISLTWRWQVFISVFNLNKSDKNTLQTKIHVPWFKPNTVIYWRPFSYFRIPLPNLSKKLQQLENLCSSSLPQAIQIGIKKI